MQWQEVEPGFSVARYHIGTESQVLKSEVFLLKFNLASFSIDAVAAEDLGEAQSDVESLTKKSDAVAGINANFFDENGDPLGLLVTNFKSKRRLHQGGKLLTGVFSIADDKASIVHRSAFTVADNTRTAVQAGPRLISGSQPQKLLSPDVTSRRSGVAITRTGEVIFFATLLRFPGATLGQVQQMLLDPRLDVVDALNLDGGGSSQLFIRGNAATANDMLITGGDKVPAALVARRKGKSE